MRRIDNPEQPYPFNNEEFPYVPMAAQEAAECLNNVVYLGKDDLLDIFEAVLDNGTNIEDVAWIISASSVGERRSDNPDNDLCITTEEHPVDVFAYGICFGLWASCPDTSQDGSVFVSDDMNASIADIGDKSSQLGLFKYSQACLDFVHNNDPAYFRLAVDAGQDIYGQQSSVPFLYGAAAGRMLFMFRQADIMDEINAAWEQYNQKPQSLKISEPWLN